MGPSDPRNLFIWQKKLYVPTHYHCLILILSFSSQFEPLPPLTSTHLQILHPSIDTETWFPAFDWYPVTSNTSQMQSSQKKSIRKEKERDLVLGEVIVDAGWGLGVFSGWFGGFEGGFDEFRPKLSMERVEFGIFFPLVFFHLIMEFEECCYHIIYIKFFYYQASEISHYFLMQFMNFW